MRISHIQPMREYSTSSATRRLVAFALAAGLSFTASPSHAPARSNEASAALTGAVRVIDGDTLVVNDTRVRLEGIDAPEAGQTCKRKWIGWWSCGTAATN